MEAFLVILSLIVGYELLSYNYLSAIPDIYTP